MTAAIDQHTEQSEPRPAHLFRPGESGNPSGCNRSKRYLELRASIVGDLGGEDQLSGIERVMVEQATNLLIKAERTADTERVVRASNAASRLLRTLTEKRAARERKAKRPMSIVEIMRSAP